MRTELVVYNRVSQVNTRSDPMTLQLECKTLIPPLSGGAESAFLTSSQAVLMPHARGRTSSSKGLGDTAETQERLSTNWKV